MTTFLLAMPRAGSLALSVIMNNHSCIAHHEGEDFSFWGNVKEWHESRASDYHRSAMARGSDYFCCDTCVTPELVLAYLNAHPGEVVQFVVIKTDAKRTVDSYERLGLNSRGLLKALNTSHQRLSATLANVRKGGYHKFLYIDKVEGGEALNGSKFFTRSQLTEIAEFVGAKRYKGNTAVTDLDMIRMDYLRTCHISLTPEKLRQSMGILDKCIKSNIKAMWGDMPMIGEILLHKDHPNKPSI